MSEMTRAEFEAQLARVFGPDWRSKAIVGPFAVFPLRDLPGEMGFPPEPNPSSGAVGLWQTLPLRRPWRT